jgi:SAM-dependent methyltransferase
MSENVISLKPADFIKSFESNLSTYVQQKIEEYKFKYVEMSTDEYNENILKIVKTLLSDNITKSGEHRVNQWEKGWSENLEKLEHNPAQTAIIPAYYDKYHALRWQQKFIKPQSDKFELNMLAIILDWLADKYMREASSVYEFGCGTGHHLPRIRSINPTSDLWGLDWVESSQKIIQSYAQKISDQKLFAHKFDYFNPDFNFKLKKDSVLYTVASLEQIGNKHDKFIDYILQNNPKLCIHIEPIAELLDENNLLDYLSIEYFKKRNYLSGFLSQLQHLENEGRIKIIRAQRTYIGSLFIDGYSVIVWTPQV